MPKYNLTIYIDGTPPQLLSKQVSYDAEYQLSADVANIGVKGYVSKIGDTTEYFPPHRIYKIDIEEIKS